MDLVKHSLNNSFVLGLSGGPDSITLLSLLMDFKLNNVNLKIKIYPVIIDHSIRPNSFIESEKTKKYSEQLGFQTKIKKIKLKAPISNLQNWARKHRRKILISEAKKKNSNLLLAHHSNDQAETIFMRLNKSSGFVGLAGMKMVDDWQGTKIIRPLISFQKELIIKYIQKRQLFYINDTSNNNLKFERVKTRKLLKKIDFEKKYLTTSSLIRLSKLSERLLSNSNLILKSWIEKNIIYYEHGSVSLVLHEFMILNNFGKELSSLIFAKVLQNVGGKIYAPNKSKLIRKIDLLITGKLKKFTLGNVLIYIKADNIVFVRENRNLILNQIITSNCLHFFDGRFAVTSQYEGKLFLVNNFSFNLVEFNDTSLFSKKKNYINKTLPCLKTLEGRVIKPYLNIIDKKDISKIQFCIDGFNLFFIKDIDFR